MTDIADESRQRFLRLRRAVILIAVLLPLAFPMGTLATADGVHDQPSNVVSVYNQRDNTSVTDGRVQLNVMEPAEFDGKIDPVNQAYAVASCQGCAAIAVALQLDLVLPGRITEVAPVNSAAGINYQCSGCVALAQACQEVVSISSEDAVSPALRHQFDALNRQLRAVSRDRDLQPAEAIQRFNEVIARFVQLVRQFDPNFQCAPLPGA